MPGYLALGDLSAIVEQAAPAEPRLFVLDNFVASEGAKAGKINEQGLLEVFQIPTISPAQKPDGRCVFLSDDGLCQIHAVSPFGCSKADSHIAREVMDKASGAALAEIYYDKQTDGPYVRTWQMLTAAGKIARPRAERRAAFEREYAETQ